MWNEFYFSLAVFCALLVFMIDYSLGQPGNEKWSSGELFSNWSFLLAAKRLMREGRYDDLYKQAKQQILSSPKDEKMIQINFKQVVFAQAKPYFHWEKALGMCPICFHFWITLVTFNLVNIFYYSVNIFTFTFYLLISHLIIRLLKKFL